ncbi:MAG: class I SAM-dependent methyltransferase, partial [Umezawaea sp.]
MGYGFSQADVAYLRSDAGCAALAEVGRLPLTDRLADVTAARRIAGEEFAAVLETVLLR